MKTADKRAMAMAAMMAMTGSAWGMNEQSFDAPVMSFKLSGGDGPEDELVVTENGEAYATRKLVGEEQSGWGYVSIPICDWICHGLGEDGEDDEGTRALVDRHERAFRLTYTRDGSERSLSGPADDDGTLALLDQVREVHDHVLNGDAEPRSMLLKATVHDAESGSARGMTLTSSGVLTLWEANRDGARRMIRQHRLDAQQVQLVEQYNRALVDQAAQDDGTRQMEPRIIIDRLPRKYDDQADQGGTIQPVIEICVAAGERALRMNSRTMVIHGDYLQAFQRVASML